MRAPGLADDLVVLAHQDQQPRRVVEGSEVDQVLLVPDGRREDAHDPVRHGEPVPGRNRSVLERECAAAGIADRKHGQLPTSSFFVAARSP